MCHVSSIRPSTSLDRARWCTRFQYGGGPPPQEPDAACQSPPGHGTLDHLHDEQQRYVDRNTLGQSMHAVAGGVLSLRVTKTGADPQAPYESAMIRSKQTFRPSPSVSYYLTARVRLPRVRGTWPAFWLAPAVAPDGSAAWPPEIDIMEGALNDGYDTQSMLRMGAQPHNWGGQGPASAPLPALYRDPSFDPRDRKVRAARNLRGVWIEVGLDWQDRQSCYFIDGVKMACEPYEWLQNDHRPAPASPLLLILAIGGPWAGRGGIEDERLPASFDVAHVRVYEQVHHAP